MKFLRARLAPMSRLPGVRRARLATRVDDGVQGFRERWGRRHGLAPTVIPSTGYGTESWIRVLGRVVLTRPGVGDDDSTHEARVRGWRSFTSTPVRDAEVVIEIDGRESTVVADRGGVVDAHVHASLPGGWHTIRLRAGDGEPAEERVFVVSDDVRFGVVSDIDDTVMVTALPRPFLAAWNTFVLDEHARSPVPGMSVLYDRVLRAHPGAPVVYLSTGAWNASPALSRFLERNFYPPGALLLTDWGPTSDRWFRNGPKHKRESLRRLVREFPDIRWLLIGDDGQHDPTLYAELAAEYPDHVEAIAIRTLTTGEAVLAGGRRPTDEGRAPVPTVTAPDGAELFVRLADLDVVSGTPSP